MPFHQLTLVDRRHFLHPQHHAGFVRAVRDALVRDGFLLVGGFDGELEETFRPYDLSRRELFSLNDDQLLKYEARGADGAKHRQRGFSPLQSEHAKDRPGQGDLKRFWMTRHEEKPRNPQDNPFGPNIWPTEVPSFRPHAIAYMNLLVEAGREILAALDESYGFEDGRLEQMTHGAETMLRSIHYPTIDRSRAAAGAVRSAEHEDINLYTAMKAVQGLQILVDGVWVDVESPLDTVVFNTGDMAVPVDGITDMRAMKHRVLNPPNGDDSERFSDPCFIHATHSTWLNPSLRAGDWLYERLRQINA